MTKDCTLLVMTANRNFYLDRFLKYHIDNKNDMDIIIGDSSYEEEDRVRNKDIVKKYNKLKISYYEYDKDIFLYKKLQNMIKECKTKYSIICTDDDFVIPKSIKLGVDFLEDNEDYSSVGGYFVRYKEIDDLIHWHEIYLSDLKYIEDITERVLYYISNNSSTLYNVHRTKQLSKMLNHIVKYTDPWDQFGEYTFNVLSSYYGNIKRLDILFGIREKPPIKEKIRVMEESKKQSFVRSHSQYKDIGLYKKRFDKFIEGIIELLPETNNIEGKLRRAYLKYKKGKGKSTERHTFTEEDINDLYGVLDIVNPSITDKKELVWLNSANTFIDGPNYIKYKNIIKERYK